MDKLCHSDLKSSRMRRNERDVNQIRDLFQKIWKDPFDENELCNLATAVEAADEIRSSWYISEGC